MQAVINALKLGLSRSTAAKIVGCSVTTIADECNRNPEFSEALKEAEGACEQALVAMIYSAAKKGQWTAAAWLLERKFRKRYARPAPIPPPEPKRTDDGGFDEFLNWAESNAAPTG